MNQEVADLPMPREIALGEISGFVGQELGVSDWMELSQQRIEEFAAATGDHHWMHVDVARATRELGGPIAHGLLTLSLLPLLSNQIMRLTGYASGFSYGYDRLRFTHPVPAGRRVRLRQTLLSVEPRGAAQLLRVACTIELEGAEAPALLAEWLSLYYPP